MYYFKVLPLDLQQRLLDKYQARLTSAGEILIESRRSRNREKNRLDAAERLKALILNFLHPPKKRSPSKPTYNSVKRRIASKKKHGANKKLRSSKPTLD